MNRATIVAPSSGVRTVTLSVILTTIISCVSAKAAEYWVDPENGRDIYSGTSDRPWRTLTHALSEVHSGAVINVASGTYGSDNCESSPIVLPRGIRLRGSDKASTIICVPILIPDPASRQDTSIIQGIDYMAHCDLEPFAHTIRIREVGKTTRPDPSAFGKTEINTASVIQIDQGPEKFTEPGTYLLRFSFRKARPKRPDETGWKTIRLPNDLWTRTIKVINADSIYKWCKNSVDYFQTSDTPQDMKPADLVCWKAAVSHYTHQLYVRKRIYHVENDDLLKDNDQAVLIYVADGGKWGIREWGKSSPVSIAPGDIMACTGMVPEAGDKLRLEVFRATHGSVPLYNLVFDTKRTGDPGPDYYNTHWRGKYLETTVQREYSGALTYAKYGQYFHISIPLVTYGARATRWSDLNRQRFNPLRLNNAGVSTCVYYVFGGRSHYLSSWLWHHFGPGLSISSLSVEDKSTNEFAVGFSWPPPTAFYVPKPLQGKIAILYGWYDLKTPFIGLAISPLFNVQKFVKKYE
jgi:hypothetical protein